MMDGVVGPSLSITEADLGSRKDWCLLGRGNFSTVYKAFCNRHNGFVAVKEIHRGSLQEVKKLMMSLPHNHIITIKAVDEDRNLIIMEFCPYSLQGLRSRLGDSFIPWPQCINFMQQIMSGLEYLHFIRIVHRDLKPANVLVTEDFVCKIADLGLAKEEGSYSNSSSSGDIKCPSGTPVYISPERWDNPGQRAGETDDIYSCGILMYKMITNENIFAAEGRGANDNIFADLKLWVAHKKRRPHIENIHRGEDRAPPIVEEVILACWDPEIEKRRTSKYWADHLREYIKNNIRIQELEDAKQLLRRLLAQNARTGPTPIDPSTTQSESLDPGARGDRVSGETGRVDVSDCVDSHTNSEPQPLHTEGAEATIVPSRVEPEGQQPPLREDRRPWAVTEDDDDPGDNGGRRGEDRIRHLSSREDLEGRMSNLCVDGEIDVMILDDSNGVAQHYQLELFTPYQLNFHHGMKQMVFHHDGNQPVHIPHSLVHSYRLGPEGDNTLHLYFPCGKPLTLSVSSIERAVSGLEALAVLASPDHEQVSPEKLLKTVDYYEEQPKPAAHWKDTGHHNDSGYGTPRIQPPQRHWSPDVLHPKSHNQPVVPPRYPNDASSSLYSTSVPPPPYSRSLPPPQYPTNFPSPLFQTTATHHPNSVGQQTHPPPMPPFIDPNSGGYSAPPRELQPYNRTPPESHQWAANQLPPSSQYMRDTSPSHHPSLPSTAAPPNSIGQQSQPMSGVYIGHVEHYYQYPSGYTAPAQAPSTTHRPPYGRSRLTESATMVSQSDMLEVQTDVSREYERMGRLLGIEEGNIEYIRAQNSGNLEEASYQLMKAWVGENGSGASRARLARALYEARLYDAAKIL